MKGRIEESTLRKTRGSSRRCNKKACSGDQTHKMYATRHPMHAIYAHELDVKFADAPSS